MNDAVQEFHAAYSGRSGDGGYDGWHEPAEGKAASWEEPQWDEPRSAVPSSAHTSERLTPARLRAVVFRRAPLGKRGLDEHQVNNLLDRVEEEMILLIQEKEALAAEAARLRERTSTPAPATSPPSSQEGETAVSPPGRGSELKKVDPEDQADSQTVVSRVHEAHMYAAGLLAQAQQTADQYIQDAQQYSRELIEDARRKRLELLAKVSSAAPGEDPGGREATRLRVMSQQYRGKLRDHFERLLADLDEWDSADGIAALPKATEPPH